MEKYRSTEIKIPTGPGESELFETGESSAVSQRRTREEEELRAQLISKEHESKYNRTAWRNRIIGATLSLLGMGTMVSACPMSLFTTIGPETAIFGLGLIIAGGVFLFRKPKVKDTNRALMIALKYGNVLTVSRLALEMDISFDKAEKIIQELVRKGIAEIDLEGEGADHSLIYRIKGL